MKPTGAAATNQRYFNGGSDTIKTTIIL